MCFWWNVRAKPRLRSRASSRRPIPIVQRLPPARFRPVGYSAVISIGERLCQQSRNRAVRPLVTKAWSSNEHRESESRVATWPHSNDSNRNEDMRVASNQGKTRGCHARKNYNNICFRKRPARLRWRHTFTRTKRRAAHFTSGVRSATCSRQGDFPRTVRQLSQREWRQTAQNRRGFERARTFRGSDCTSRERPPTRSSRGRASRGYVIHIELDEEQESGK
jgi:hypothetical protein